MLPREICIFRTCEVTFRTFGAGFSLLDPLILPHAQNAYHTNERRVPPGHPGAVVHPSYQGAPDPMTATGLTARERAIHAITSRPARLAPTF